MEKITKRPEKLVFREIALVTNHTCNLQCRHCGRGEPDAQEMPTETIDHVLDQIEGVDRFIITGGEPMLAPDTLLYLLREIKRRKIPISDLQMVSNGIIRDERIASAFLDIAADKDILKAKPGITISISDDEWHREFLSDEDINGALVWWRDHVPDKKNIKVCLHEDEDKEKTGLVYSGRAKKALSELTEKIPVGYFCNKHRIQLTHNEKGFYVACGIDIDCDGSVLLDESVYAWEDAQNLSIGNVNAAPILDIITAHNEKYPNYCEDCDALCMGRIDELTKELFGSDAMFSMNSSDASAWVETQEERLREHLGAYRKAFNLTDATINDLLRIEDVYWEFADGVWDIISKAYTGNDDTAKDNAANEIVNRLSYGNGTPKRVVKQILQDIGIDEHTAVLATKQMHRLYNGWMAAAQKMGRWAQIMQAARKMHPALTELETVRFVNAMLANPDRLEEIEADTAAYENVYDIHKKYPALTPDDCRMVQQQLEHAEPTEKKLAHGQEVTAQEMREYTRHMNVVKWIVG